VTASYGYDGDGVRTSKTVNGTTTRFQYDPTASIPTLLTSTGATPKPEPQHGKPGGTSATSDCQKGKDGHRAKASDRRHEPAPADGKPGHEPNKSACAIVTPANVGTDLIYGPDGNPIEQATAGSPALYLHADQLGSSRLVTDTHGKALTRYNYTPYGTLRPSKDQHGQPIAALLYGGSYHDSESGLYYLQARYYDPQTAQFLTRDPLEALSGQPYTYAAGSPLNATDPTGLMLIGEEGGGGPAPVAHAPGPSRNSNGRRACGGSGDVSLAQLLLKPIGAGYTAGGAVGRRIGERPTLLSRAWRSGAPAERSAAAGSIKAASRLAKVPWARALLRLGQATPFLDFAAGATINLSNGESAPRAFAVAGLSTAAGFGGGLAGGIAVCGAGAVTGPGDLLICPVGIVAGAMAGGAIIDYLDSFF
jgi:RHS repeat-associated protein